MQPLPQLVLIFRLMIRKNLYILMALAFIIIGTVLLVRDSMIGFLLYAVAMAVLLYVKLASKEKATSGWWQQFWIAVAMTSGTACFWYLTAPYSSQCGSYSASPQLPYCVLTFTTGFTSVLMLWVVGICALCRFPDQENTEDLFHSTPSWTAIKQRGCVFPTADGQIYLIDRDERLGKKSANGVDSKLIFIGAKKCGIAKKTQFGPFAFLRFKTGRGEWLAEPFHFLSIQEFHECEGSNEVMISRYTLKKLEGKMRLLLRLRRGVSQILISPVFVAVLVGALILEKSYARRFNWYELWMVWCIVGVASLVVIGYFIQGKFNAYLFKSAQT